MSGRGYILRVTEESVVFLANLEGGTTELYRNHVLVNSVLRYPIISIVPLNATRS